MDAVQEIKNKALYRVVDKAGGVSALARQLKVTRQAIYSWLDRGFVPPVRAVQLEEMFSEPRQRLIDPKLNKLLGSSSFATATSDLAHVPYRPRPR